MVLDTFAVVDTSVSFAFTYRLEANHSRRGDFTNSILGN